MWELYYKESWMLKNWYFWTVVLAKTFESLLDCKEIQPVNPKENQSWIFIGRADTEAETPILWPPDEKNWLTGKDPDAGKDWRWEEKGMTEDEMVGWYHWLKGHEFEQASGVGDRQGSLAYCNPWGCKESDMTERLNWTEKEAHFWLLKMMRGPKVVDVLRREVWKRCLKKGKENWLLAIYEEWWEQAFKVCIMVTTTVFHIAMFNYPGTSKG